MDNIIIFNYSETLLSLCALDINYFVINVVIIL